MVSGSVPMVRFQEIQRHLEIVHHNPDCHESWRILTSNLEFPPRVPQAVEVWKRLLAGGPSNQTEESLKEWASKGLWSFTRNLPGEPALLSIQEFWHFVAENWPFPMLGNAIGIFGHRDDPGKVAASYDEHVQEAFKIARDPARPLSFRQRALLAIWNSNTDQHPDTVRGEVDRVGDRIFELAKDEPDLFWPVIDRSGGMPHATYRIRPDRLLPALIAEAEKIGKRQLTEEAEEAFVEILLRFAGKHKGDRKVQDLIHRKRVYEFILQVLKRQKELQSHLFIYLSSELRDEFADKIIQIARRETALWVEGALEEYGSVFYALGRLHHPKAEQVLADEVKAFLRIFAGHRKPQYRDLFRVSVALSELHERGVAMDPTAVEMILGTMPRRGDQDIAFAVLEVFKVMHQINPGATESFWRKFTGCDWSSKFWENRNLLEFILRD